jgi:cytochrome b involved in lipid metabolism
MKNIKVIISLFILGLLAGAFVLWFGDRNDEVLNSDYQNDAEVMEEKVGLGNDDEEVVATTSVSSSSVMMSDEKSDESKEAPVSLPAAKPTLTEATPAVVADSAPEPVKVSGITMAEVRTHADASSCWSAINGSVYDLTAYIPKHPGGKGEILAICGKDGSSAFDGQHGGDAKPERILASYKIDVLAN